MRTVILKPGKFAKVDDIDLSYQTLSNFVGGYIEMTYPFSDEEIAVISNEEAKLLDLPPNRAIRNSDGRVLDIYCGPMIVVALDHEGNYRSLTRREIDLVMKEWLEPESKADWGGVKPRRYPQVVAMG